MFVTLLCAALLAQTPAATPAKKTAPVAAKKPVAKKSTPAKTTKTAPKKTVAKKASTPVTPTKPLATDDEKTLYALGLSIHRSLGPFSLSAEELEIVKRGLTDASQQKSEVDITVYGPKIQDLAQARRALAIEREKSVAAEFLAKAAAAPGASKTESGLVYRKVSDGTGESPKATDTVKVNYRGTLTDGTEFDSSYKRGVPASFPLNGVIKCWTEGVQLMKVGEKAVLTCPSNLAYGENGTGPIPGGATLTFEIELLEIVTNKE
ncbi:MAG: FKBP-type peptidyl-prolyl cis-trans isomerase [Bryobacter sp.]|nr:FKBP-type peptidyl-prolyl cis-trans isomerase [Bryobacter sp.]